MLGNPLHFFGKKWNFAAWAGVGWLSGWLFVWLGGDALLSTI
jgi:hypothetical protein